MSGEIGTPEEEVAWEEFLEGGGRRWVVALAYGRKPGRRPKALFTMSHRDARSLCSDERTKGRGWMAFMARLEDWQEKGVVPAKYRIKDTGRLDPIIEELGLTKIPL